MTLSEQDREALVAAMVPRNDPVARQYWRSTLTALTPSLEALIARHVIAALDDMADEFDALSDQCEAAYDGDSDRYDLGSSAAFQEAASHVRAHRPKPNPT